MRVAGAALAVGLALGPGAAAAWQDLAMPGAVGRISLGADPRHGTATCTGTLVAPDLVLTAGHCVRGAAAAPAAILFSAGMTDGTAVAEGRGAAVIFAQGQGLAADLALLRLSRRLEGIAPLPIGAESGPRLTRFGYRRDSPDTPDREDLCLILEQDGPVLRLGCSAQAGHSGAAVLSPVAGGWQVAGVMVARVTTGFGSVAVRVPADLAAVIAAD